MNAFTASYRTVCVVLVASVSMACGAMPPIEERPNDAPTSDAASTADAATTPAPVPRAHCDVPAPMGVSNLVAFPGGVVFGVTDGESSRVERWEGLGCNLAMARAPNVAGVLVDVDASGRAYVMRNGDAVMSRIEEDDSVTDVVSAGRGIWGFGVSPAGRSMWVTSCGPTGIFAMSDTSTPLMGEPATLWQLEPAVLTADDVFWSVGARDCTPGEPTTPACGFELTRSTPIETREVATTIIDFGAGYERARLARCGAGVCGMFPSGIVRWDDAGEITFTISRADLGAEDRESIVQVTGDARGVYALLTDGVVPRVVFVQAAHAR